MSMMGKMTFFLGLQVNQSPCGIFINQSNYVLEILIKYGMETCDLIGTPMETKDKLDLDQHGTLVDATKYRSMIGALMYLRSSRPDIVHATCLYARYQDKPTEKHLKKVKRIFRYLRGTVNMGLWYTKDSSFELTGFSDFDYAGCKDTFNSTSGRTQFLGEKLVSWSSKKQDCTALSTGEAEYVSLSACCAQFIWTRTQLTDYGFHFNNIPIYCDSKSAISSNQVQHSKTKHIAVRYHFIQEHIEKDTIDLYFVKTDYQLADLFTKALPVDSSTICQNWRDLPRDTSVDRVEVLGMIEKRSKVRMGIMPTEIELALEQSQQGASYEVSAVFILINGEPCRWRFHRIAAEPHSDKQELPQRTSSILFQIDQVTRSILRETVSLQVMLKDEYVGYEVFQSRKIQDYLKAKHHDIKFKSKDTKSKIKIQDHKHAKETSK
ncbi:hypothetical protein Tco_0888821 [Tanacetum coccineum]